MIQITSESSKKRSIVRKKTQEQAPVKKSKERKKIFYCIKENTVNSLTASIEYYIQMYSSSYIITERVDKINSDWAGSKYWDMVRRNFLVALAKHVPAMLHLGSCRVRFIHTL